jgi:hypothetical protein
VAKRWIVVGAAVVVAALVVTLLVTSGPSDSGYRDTASGVAHDALSAVRTVDLLSAADEDGSLLPTYRATAVDNASTKLTDAVQQLDSTEKPGPASEAVYNRLAPLLRRAVAGVGDAGNAMDRSDSGALAEARRSLRAAGDGLAEFVRSTR